MLHQPGKRRLKEPTIPYQIRVRVMMCEQLHNVKDELLVKYLPGRAQWVIKKTHGLGW